MQGMAYRSGVLAGLLGGLLLGGGLIAAGVGGSAVAGLVGNPDADAALGPSPRLLVDLGLATAGVGLALLAAGLALALVVRRRTPEAVAMPAGTPDKPLHGMVLAASLLYAGMLVAMLLLPPLVVAPGDFGMEDPGFTGMEATSTVMGVGPASDAAGVPDVQEMPTRYPYGVVRGSLNWTPTAASPPSLVLVLEVAEGDGWTEVAREEGGPGLLVESDPVAIDGRVRALVLVGGPTGVGSQEYSLTLTVLAMEPPSQDAEGE